MKIYTAVDQFKGFAALGARLDQAEKDADEAADELKDLRQKKAEKERDYTRKKASTYVRNAAKGATTARAIADQESADALFEWRVAEGLVKSGEDALQTKREIVRDIRQKMSNFQSVGSMARMEAEMAGRSGET